MKKKNQKVKQISLICAKCEQEDPRQTHYIYSEHYSLVLLMGDISSTLSIHAA